LYRGVVDTLFFTRICGTENNRDLSEPKQAPIKEKAEKNDVNQIV
jgi:hypothetical protein